MAKNDYLGNVTSIHGSLGSKGKCLLILPDDKPNQQKDFLLWAETDAEKLVNLFSSGIPAATMSVFIPKYIEAFPGSLNHNEKERIKKALDGK
jgi:hypothetical protein